MNSPIAGDPAPAARPKRSWSVFKLLRNLGGFVGKLLRNLGTAGAMAVLLRRGVEATRADGGQLVGLFVLNLAAGLAYDIYAVYPGAGRIDLSGLPASSFWALPLLL